MGARVDKLGPRLVLGFFWPRIGHMAADRKKKMRVEGRSRVLGMLGFKKMKVERPREHMHGQGRLDRGKEVAAKVKWRQAKPRSSRLRISIKSAT